MASRYGWIIVTVVIMFFGIIGKFGAALSMCPEPVIGGFNIIGLGMITAVGLSALQYTDLRSVRNLVIVGSSMMLGIMLPYFMYSHPGHIKTGESSPLDKSQCIAFRLCTVLYY